VSIRLVDLGFARKVENNNGKRTVVTTHPWAHTASYGAPETFYVSLGVVCPIDSD
jgi:hypothetical protein